jgi:hypothetical protein
MIVMNVLVIFSNPPNLPHLRLDKEDKVLTQLARKFPEVNLERQHASEIDDVQQLISIGKFDIIQFSGHGSPDGIYLEKSDIDCGELVSAKSLQNLVQLSDKDPKLAIFLNCYSDSSLPSLANVAPFVITSINEVEDEACISFVKGFYEYLFSNHPIQASFDHALKLLSVKKSSLNKSFRLSRRGLTKKGQSKYVECYPDPNRGDSILVNLDAILDKPNSLGISIEELCHLISRKLKIHYWIFVSERDRAIIPIGRLLFGEFSWKNAKDVVFCNKIIKLMPNVSHYHWELWSRLLMAYNDLASCEYRSIENPADPSRCSVLERSVRLFQHNITKYVKPLRDLKDDTNIGNIIFNIMPHIEFVVTSVERANDQLELGRNAQAITELEIALTNLHEIVDYIQPQEER